MAGGVILSFGMSDLIASQLYGVTSSDPIAGLLAVAVIFLSSAIAMLGPMLSAIRVDPASELRSR